MTSNKTQSPILAEISTSQAKNVSTSNENVLQCLNIDNQELNAQINQVFNASNSDKKEFSLLRLKLICKVYRLFIARNANATPTQTPKSQMTFYDFLNNTLCDGYNFKNVLKDFRNVTNDKQKLIEDEEINKEDDDGNDYDNCSAQSCYIMNRNMRDRSVVGSRKDRQLGRLFFVDGQDNDDKKHEDNVEYNDEIYNISCQEIMDCIYIYLYHTIRINPKDIEHKQEELRAGGDQKGGAEDKDNALYDIYTDAIIQLIENKQTLSRYKRKDNRYTYGNKFITTNPE